VVNLACTEIRKFVSTDLKTLNGQDPQGDIRGVLGSILKLIL
jgi:hypothetical protein